MANYGDNYRAGREVVICPLCNMHIDSQFLCQHCPIIKNQIDSRLQIDDLYTETISSETVRILTRIESIRQERIDVKKQQ